MPQTKSLDKFIQITRNPHYNSIAETTRIFAPKTILPQTQEEIQIFEEQNETQSNKIGMDAIPLEMLDKMIMYHLDKENYRDVMLLICHCNWGMRFSDLSRVTFNHILNADGSYKNKFSLQNGEKKTQKARYYYNNEAVCRAVNLYLEQHPEKRYYDCLFTAESNNAPKLIDIDGIKKQKALSGSAAEMIVKSTLKAIGIYTKNNKSDNGTINSELKICTHSLRKTYGKHFHEIGRKLKVTGKLNIDYDVLGLLMLDFAHSDMSTTQRYCGSAEEAKEIICKNMNIGLNLLK